MWVRPQPGLPAEDLGCHPVQVHAVRDRDVMRAVRRGDRVVVPQVRADARGDRLLPGRQVHLPGDQPGPDVECWFLVRVILPENGLLVGTAEHHHPVEIKTGLLVHDASFGLPVRCHESCR